MKGKPIEPGCLALVVSSAYTPQNIGRVVRVVQAMAPGEWNNPDAPTGVAGRIYNNRPGSVWLVECLPGSPPLQAPEVRRLTREVVRYFPTRQHCMHERHLRRIDGDDTPAHKEENRDIVSHKPKTEQVF